MERRGDLYGLVSFEVESRREVFIFTAPSDFQFLVAPDKLAILSRDLWVSDLVGVKKKCISKGFSPDNTTRLLGWTKNFRNIVYESQTTVSSFAMFDIETAKARELFEIKGEIASYSGYLPSANVIFYFMSCGPDEETGGAHDLYEVDLKGNVQAKLPRIQFRYEDAGGLPSLSPDGRRLFYYACPRKGCKLLEPLILDVSNR